MIKRIFEEAIDSPEHRHNPRFPELPLAGFGLLTHFLWEMLQVPWYSGMAEASHASVVWLCTRATGGDVVILLVSFWLASVTCSTRQWLLRGDRKPAVVLPRRHSRTRMASDWSSGTMDVCRLYANYSAVGRGLDPCAAMVAVVTDDNVAGAPTHAWPHRSPSLQT